MAFVFIYWKIKWVDEEISDRAETNKRNFSHNRIQGSRKLIQPIQLKDFSIFIISCACLRGQWTETSSSILDKTSCFITLKKVLFSSLIRF